MKTDIQSTQDIAMLVDTFYEKVNADVLFAPVFNEEAGVNWQEHMPKMYQFWGTQLLGRAAFSAAHEATHYTSAFSTMVKIIYRNGESTF